MRRPPLPSRPLAVAAVAVLPSACRANTDLSPTSGLPAADVPARVASFECLGKPTGKIQHAVAIVWENRSLYSPSNDDRGAKSHRDATEPRTRFPRTAR